MDEMNRGRTAPPPKKRPNLFVRFLTFLVTLALVVGAVVLVVNYDKLNFDSVKRWFAYRNLSRNESGQSESFSFEGKISGTFGGLGGDLGVGSATDIRLCSGANTGPALLPSYGPCPPTERCAPVCLPRSRCSPSPPQAATSAC